MKLKELDIFIGNLLVDFDTKSLPNLPNISGIFNQSDISYALIKGESDNANNYCDVNFQISVSKESRIDNESSSLYDLVYAVIYQLNKKKYPNGGLIKFTSFELFTPDSGKWRALLDFQVLVPIDIYVDDNC